MQSGEREIRGNVGRGLKVSIWSQRKPTNGDHAIQHNTMMMCLINMFTKKYPYNVCLVQSLCRETKNIWFMSIWLISDVKLLANCSCAIKIDLQSGFELLLELYRVPVIHRTNFWVSESKVTTDWFMHLMGVLAPKFRECENWLSKQAQIIDWGPSESDRRHALLTPTQLVCSNAR